MSWSIGLIGTAPKVVQALKEQSEKFDGQTKIEYDDALPHLIGIVEQNFESSGNSEVLVKVTANGHGYAVGGEQKQRYLAVNIERFYGQIIV